MIKNNMKKDFLQIINSNPHYIPIIKLMKEGKTKYEISKIVGIDKSNINKMIKIIEKYNLIEHPQIEEEIKRFNISQQFFFDSILYFENIQKKDYKKLVNYLLIYLKKNKQILNSELIKLKKFNDIYFDSIIIPEMLNFNLIKEENKYIKITQLGKYYLRKEKLFV